MNEMKDVASKIRGLYDTFSKGHQSLAEFILNNPQESAFLSISALSDRTGISAPTITRFVHKLGFDGYATFQRELYEAQAQIMPFSQLKSLLRNSAGSSPETATGEGALFLGIEANLRLMEALYTPQLQEAFTRTLGIIQNAHKIYIAGQRSSFSIAHYLSFMLQRIYSNVVPLNATASALPSELSDVREDDCLVAISYSRYTKATYNVVSYFHRLGCKIAAITDSPTSPIALKASEVMIAPNGEYFSPVCAMTLCNCLIAALGSLDVQRTLERMELQDNIAIEHDIYL